MSNFPKWNCVIRKSFGIVQVSKYFHTRKRFISSYSILNQNEGFKMPDYVPRTNTDILKALDSTVKRDKTGPHYTFHDDPFLTPLNNINKRNFALSKESGIRAAKWIRDNNSDLFISTADDPVINALNPVEEFTEESTVSELMLQELIESRRVKDSVAVYYLCKDKGIDINSSTQQSLLELLCYTNEEDSLSTDFVEEKFYTRPERPGVNKQNDWKTDGLAEELFLSQETPSVESYNVLIRGMAAYNHVDGAWEHYYDALEKGVAIDLQTLNALIPTTVLLHDSHDDRWSTMMKILKTIADRKLTPDLTTLNNCLQVFGVSSSFRKARVYCLQLVKEMSLQGVQPSLATYYFLLLVFYRRRGPLSNALHQILDVIEKEDLQVRDHRDRFFFCQAMEVCNNNLNCLETAHRLHSIVSSSDNSKFLSSNFFESIYYRNYLELGVKSLPTEEFMSFYNKIVPHVFAPDFALMETIVTSVATLGTFEYIPTLWTDMVAMNLVGHSKVIDSLLSTLCQYTPQEDPFKIIAERRDVDKQESSLGNEQTEVVGLTEQISRIPCYLIKQIKEQNTRQKWTGKQCGQILQILSVCGGIEESEQLFTALKHDCSIILGEIPPYMLKQFSFVAVEKGYGAAALASSIQCKAYDPVTAKNMAANVAQMKGLESKYRARLAIEFGADIFKSKNETED